MKRLTEHHFKKQDGFYMTCSEHCSKEDFSCEDCGELDKLVDRLGAIEEILGDEYDLERLRVIMDAEQHGGLIVGYGPGDPGEPGELGVMEEVAADYVVVVRCRECKHYREHRTKTYGNLICRCTRMGRYDMDYPVRPDDFCSYGERSTKK